MPLSYFLGVSFCHPYFPTRRMILTEYYFLEESFCFYLDQLRRSWTKKSCKWLNVNNPRCNRGQRCSVWYWALQGATFTWIYQEDYVSCLRLVVLLQKRKAGLAPSCFPYVSPVKDDLPVEIYTISRTLIVNYPQKRGTIDVNYRIYLVCCVNDV
jgi:hypothetical protein